MKRRSVACLLLKGHTVFHPRHFKDPDGYQLEAAVDLMSKSLGQTVELSYKQVVDSGLVEEVLRLVAPRPG